MAKYCGKCGSKLDEQTGRCPVCFPENSQIHEDKGKTSGRANRRKGARKKRQAKKGLLPLMLVVLVLLLSFVGLIFFQVIRVPFIEDVITKVESLFLGKSQWDIIEVYKEYEKDYTLVEESEDGTYTLSVVAPDITVLIEQVAAWEESGADDDQREEYIQTGSIPDREYIFQTNSVDETEISDAFLEQVAYDLTIYAIANTEMPSFE